jgi:hypothetical protein
MQSETKQCQNCKKDFTVESEDFKFYEKIKVPPPTFCPECRMQRRFAVRNERNLYHRECDLCGKKIISMYSKEKSFPVYCHNCWWGDKWDPMDYGVDYDLKKTFLFQFKSLLEKVPRPALVAPNVKNCDYCNYIADGKDSYLCFGSIAIENCLYGSPYESKYCVDTYLARECEYCYECIDCEKLSHSSYCQECAASFDLLYCFKCRNCHDCIGCAGLRNKQYYIFNEPFSKEEFLKEREKMFKKSSNELISFIEKFKEVKNKVPHRFANILQCTSVSGDHMVQSKNAHNCFDFKKCENIKYCKQVIEAKEVYDTNYCEFMELCCEYIGFWKIQHTKFSNTCGESNNLFYSDFCSSSHNLFACVGLRNKQYCILNKQYTKEEYEALVPKIIKHMNDMPYKDSKGRIYKYGEFFPSELSPFSYNETIAQEYFPLTKEEALEQGYKWKEREERNYAIDIKNKDIPNDIKDVTDSIINKVIECEHKGTCNEQCTEAFKIIPDELSFYQRMNLPLPHFCPNCRHYQRLKQRNPLKLWHRHCMKEGCLNEFETSYAPDRPEIVYCERCYNQEVY